MVVCTGLANLADAATFTFGFSDDLPCGQTISQGGGTQVVISGRATLDASETGVAGLTQAIVVSTETGTFCVDPTVTEACEPNESCKAPFFPVAILALFPTPTSFVVQNEEDGCANGAGDPNEEPNDGRRGIVDSTLFSIGQFLPAGLFDTLPIDFVLDVPTDPGVPSVFRIHYDDDLRGSGQPQRTGVSFMGATVAGCDNPDIVCGVCEITLRATARGSIPGDADGDGVSGVLDAISLLEAIFLDGGLPCDDGFDGPCNIEILDSNGSGRIDMSDAIHFLRFVVLGDEPPAGGNGDGSCSRIDGAPQTCDA